MFLIYQDRLIRALLIIGGLSVILGGIRIITRKRWKKRFFIKSEIFLLGTAMVFVLFGYFGKRVQVSNANTKVYSLTALRNDLNQLEDILLYQSPLYYSDREELEHAFELVRTQLKEGMTEEEFYRIINPLVVKVECGHTNLSISKALQKNREENAKFFPITVQVEGKTLVDQNTKETIISINGVPSEKIITTLLQNISRDGDNLAGAYYILNLSFATKYYDFIGQPNEFLIEYKKSDGTIETKTVMAVYEKKYNTNAWELRMDEYDNVEYYSSAFDQEVATLRIRFFKESDQSFSSFLKDFFSEVQSRSCKKVIIDVRGNFGGDPRMAKELLSYLVTQPFDYFASNATLLEKIVGYDKKVVPKADFIPFDSELWIDGACFSTCGHFAAIYQSLNLGTIKGTPTGGGSICTDGAKNIVLYETGMRLHYATRVYKVNASCDFTNVVCPDEEIELQ